MRGAAEGRGTGRGGQLRPLCHPSTRELIGKICEEITGMLVCLAETENTRLLAPSCCPGGTTWSQFLLCSHLSCYFSSLKANISTSREDSHHCL